MDVYKLTQAHEQLLRDQVIDTSRPGTIVRDFHMLMDFVGPLGVKAAGKYNLLPIDAIADLDGRLSRPLCLALKRPLLQSHPYLQGLHLLLRATGLSRVAGSGDGTRLLIDPDMLQRWTALNPTEQYFTLLEAWLRKARPEMAGERGRSWGGFLSECLRAWQSLPATGLKFDLSRPQHVLLPGLYREFYLVALMDLFGMLEVEHPSQPVQPWCPAGLKHTPFGDAVFTLLGQWWFTSRESFREDDEAAGFGKWQLLLQPYFPEWRQNLSFPEAQARKGTFIFRVSLGKMWRRIAMPADASLDDLLDWILEAVDFDHDHLYEFTYRDRFGGRVRAVHPACDDGPWADQIAIGELPLEPGQSLNLVYDFGDSWKFAVKLECIEPRLGKKPRILERQGKAPVQYPDYGE